MRKVKAKPRPKKPKTEIDRVKLGQRFHLHGITLDTQPELTALQQTPRDSVESYEAFRLYIDFKDKQKGGINEVAKHLHKSPALINRWSQRHGWIKRYKLYQNQVLMMQEREQRRALRIRATEWANRRINIREEGFEVGRMLVERGRLLLALPVTEKEVRGVVTTASGEVIETLTILNFQQHPRDAKPFIEAGIKLMRMSADMSTENIAVLDADVDLDNMSDEELESYATRLTEIRQLELKGEVA